MNKYIALIIVIALGVGYFMSRKTFGPRTEIKEAITEEQLLKLPDAWTKIEDKDVNLKLEKKVDSGLRPQIVFKEVQSDDALTPAKYTDRIIAGAKSAIPSLKINSDMRNSLEKYYSAFISGTYTNKGQKINLMQRVYIKDKTVYVMTASYIGDLSTEVGQIFDNLAREKAGI